MKLEKAMKRAALEASRCRAKKKKLTMEEEFLKKQKELYLINDCSNERVMQLVNGICQACFEMSESYQLFTSARKEKLLVA